MNRISYKYNHLSVSFLLVLLLIAIEFFGLSKYLENFLQPIFLPVQVQTRKIIDVVERPFFDFKRSVNSARKVQMLEYRYSEALAQLSDLQRLQNENRELKALLENTDRKARDTVITSPVVSNIGPTIGVGRVDGIEEGNLVFVAQTLVGRVSKVEEHFSRINLIFQKDFKPLVVETSQGYKGLIKGDGKRAVITEMNADQVPENESRVVTVGQLGIEQGLFIGQIGQDISHPSDPIKSYVVNQYIDFYQAGVVEVYK